ncbi:MAG: undecaprenyl/decaprenyl-phosphate alpha-N-acetylglucosaminyl 1-phosphate transferase [Deltaproteobacteria bacterium]|nr:undecaprenyl/decaprenyl-phosphate alpha-N-acetylglucosaminyl 1-phosphate transferase [Deltaproteobacteria bacterium]
MAFFVSLAVAIALTPMVLRMALARGLFDRPDERKVHERPIPRLGGIAIVIAFFVPVTGLLIMGTGASQAFTSAPQLVGLYVGGLLIAALGLFDDLRGANAIQKLFVQIGVGALMYVLDYRIEAISNPFGGTIELGLLSLPVTLLWFVGVMNAVNLIDGLDGLAGGIGLISVLTLLALALMDGNVIGALLCSALAGALVGFLFFNFNPARIFMGDTGSLFLGFVLGAFSIASSAKGSTAVALTVPILALGLPIVDTMLAIGRRVRANRPIFSADQDHIHHRLLRAGFSHRNAVLTLYVVAAMLAGAALLVRAASQPIAGLIVLAAAVVLFVLLRALSQRRAALQGVQDPFGLDGRARRAAVDQLAARIRQSPAAAEVAPLIDDLATSTRALAVIITHGARALYVWQREATPHESLRTIASYRVPLLALGAPESIDTIEAALEVRFVRSDDGSADLAMALPWERVAPSLAASLERHAWAPLQEPAPARPTDELPILVLPAVGGELKRLATAPLTTRAARPQSQT